MAMGGRAACVCVRVAAAGQGMCHVHADCGGLRAASAAHAQRRRRALRAVGIAASCRRPEVHAARLHGHYA